MQIVIDIPDEFYKRIQDDVYSRYDGVDTLKAVRNGTPLSKGHGRLIDADKVYDDFQNGTYDFEDALEYAPTIIEADKEGEK